jgi:hypothetical protein
MRSRPRGDEGTVMLLSLGFAVLAMMLVLVVTAATQVHLERLRLARLADELALDAADALDAEAYYASAVGEPGEVTLAKGAVREVVRERLEDASARAGFEATSLIEASTSDGATASVTVATVVHPLFAVDALLPFADGITLTATSSARGQ